jgi:hypothetical protein
VDSKPIWQSKTFWLNALTAAAGVLVVLSGMAEQIPSPYIEWIGVALAIVNIGLRLVTDQPVTITTK